MKNTSSGLLFTVIFSACLFACSKNSSKTPSDSGSGALTLSQSSVRRGQPLVITAPAGIASGIKWSVSPSGFAHFSYGNGQAMVMFDQRGKYQVTASYAGSNNDSSFSSSPVTVTDSVYTPVSSDFDTLSLAGDQVTLTPLLDSSSNLVLLAQTSNLYDCWPTFIYSIEVGGNSGIAIRFYSVVSGSVTGNCSGARNPAASYLFLNDALRDFADGEYPLSVTLNSTIYQGSLTITHDSFKFTWNYHSGVIISPLQIPRP